MHPPRRRFAPVAALLLAATLAACSDGPGLLPDPRLAAPGGPSAAGSPAPACKTNDPAFSAGYVMGRDINLELNDYGRILSDADEPVDIACVDSAASKLTRKVKAGMDRNPGQFQSFLSGALVSFIYAAADRIGANGGMTWALDDQLRRLESTFTHDETADGCALQSTDNCMDGAAVSASGYGMMAAWKYGRGDPESSMSYVRQKASFYIGRTFAEACVFVGFNQPTLCKTDLSQVTAADSTMSMNLGHRYPAYGFGLMTSIAAAVFGYDASGYSYQFLPHEKTIARLLFREMQLTVAAPDSFHTNCPRLDFVNGAWRDMGRTADCGGSAGYRPQMYALYDFYAQKIGQIPAGAYQSTIFNKNRFFKDEFFSWGRYMGYGKMAFEWFKYGRSHMPRTDYYAPQGALERITATRSVEGWACDRDVPLGSVRVTLFTQGKPTITQRAALSSESTINSNCGGGTAHRFAIQVPADWAGLTILAEVLDYRGFRSPLVLACPATGCMVPLPPTATVEWVLPSSASWGPANTLTAAGNARNGTGTVVMQWRDVTFSTPAWTSAPGVAPDAGGGWSATIPSAYTCHNFQVRAVYSGVTSATFTYYGRTAGYCTETSRMIWVQPASTAGFGPPGSLVAAGEAKGAPAGTRVELWYRNVTLNGGWTKKDYDAPTDANGIWVNDIPNANPYHQYAVYSKYDVITTPVCTYQGTNSNTWC